MQRKLTLHLDEDLINQGIQYARKKGISLPRLVGAYFQLLADEKSGKREFAAPVTESLRGLLRDANVGIKDYHRYIEEKHR